jgi:hypothetical protein
MMRLQRPSQGYSHEWWGPERLVGLLQHPFLPGVKGSDTVCRKMRGSLGCKLKVKPRIIWAALTRKVRGGYVHASSQLQVERF